MYKAVEEREGKVDEEEEARVEKKWEGQKLECKEQKIEGMENVGGKGALGEGRKRKE